MNFKVHVFWEGHKIDKIFTVNLTVCSNRQIDSEDFVIFVAFLENMNFNKKTRSHTSNSGDLYSASV